MAAATDVHVRVCEQEIIKYDLEIKALIQVSNLIRLVCTAHILSRPLAHELEVAKVLYFKVFNRSWLGVSRPINLCNLSSNVHVVFSVAKII